MGDKNRDEIIYSFSTKEDLIDKFIEQTRLKKIKGSTVMEGLIKKWLKDNAE